jgi:tetratricopeptide (TPR) repeat protein
MFSKPDAKSKKLLVEVESRVRSGTSANLLGDLEFLANNYSAIGAWDKAHAVTNHMVSLAEGKADASLSLGSDDSDFHTAVSSQANARRFKIIALCFVGVALIISLGAVLPNVSQKQVADWRCAIFSNDAQSFVQRADAELRLGDFAAAMADCDRALLLKPQDKTAMHIKGGIFDWQGDLESAERFNELSDKTQADYWRSKANIEYMRGQYKNAALDAHQAGIIGMYYFDFISEEYDWALTGDKNKALTAALLSETYAKSSFERAGSYRSVARSFVRLNRWDEALTACEQALALFSDYRTYGIKAESLLAKGDYDGAIKAASSAIFKDNSYSKAYEIRAAAFDKLGRSADAANDRRIVRLLGHKPSDWI